MLWDAFCIHCSLEIPRARQKEWVKPSTRAKNVFKPHTFSLNYRTGIVGQSPVVMNNLNFTGVFWTWYTFSGVFRASSN